jgi:hypothetical protein
MQNAACGAFLAGHFAKRAPCAKFGAILSERNSVSASGNSGSAWLKPTAVFAILFGLLSVMSGGAVLFSGEAAEQAAGAYVGFVLWFNFLGSFAYMAAGLGLWFHQRWGVILAYLIAVATLLVFAAFGLHVAGGAPYEMRTVWALSFRLVAWLVISLIAYLFIWRKR